MSAKEEAERPTLLILRSHIGYPSPDLTDTSQAHGEPFSEEEIKKTKTLLGLDPNLSFQVSDQVRDYMRERGRRSSNIRQEWLQRVAKLPAEEATLFESFSTLKPTVDLDSIPVNFESGTKIATRKAIQACMDAFGENLPFLIAGSADLTGNTGMKINGGHLLSKSSRDGNQVAYGIREHIMGSAMNGMALHGGILPIGGTFFIFSDYMRPTIRLAALSQAHTIFTFTHDSIGLGEDGPTHQPIEQLASLRAIPNLHVIRPADANETVTAFKFAVSTDKPTVLVASRQAIRVLNETEGKADLVLKGAYNLKSVTNPRVILIATGSEVQLALDVSKLLEDENISASVVSMPSWDLFELQTQEYRKSLLPDNVLKVSIEAGSTLGWDRYSNLQIGLNRFGSSAPADINFEKLGFSPESILAKIKSSLI